MNNDVDLIKRSVTHCMDVYITKVLLSYNIRCNCECFNVLITIIALIYVLFHLSVSENESRKEKKPRECIFSQRHSSLCLIRPNILYLQYIRVPVIKVRDIFSQDSALELLTPFETFLQIVTVKIYFQCLKIFKCWTKNF